MALGVNLQWDNAGNTETNRARAGPLRPGRGCQRDCGDRQL